MDRDPAVEIVNSENRKSICQLGPIQPTFDFPATVAGNGRRYRFQVSKWFCLYSVQPKVTLQVNFCFKYSNGIVGLRHYFKCKTTHSTKQLSLIRKMCILQGHADGFLADR